VIAANLRPRLVAIIAELERLQSDAADAEDIETGDVVQLAHANLHQLLLTEEEQRAHRQALLANVLDGRRDCPARGIVSGLLALAWIDSLTKGVADNDDLLFPPAASDAPFK
jgi:hypothetical protein